MTTTSPGGEPSLSTVAAMRDELIRPEFPWAGAAQATGILAAVGASVAAFGQTLALQSGSLAAFYEQNSAGDDVRRRLITALGVGALAPVLVAIVVAALRRGAWVPAMRRVAHQVMPLSLAVFLPILFAYKPWHDKPLTYLVILSAVTLGLERMLRTSLAAWGEALAPARGITLSPRLSRALPFALVVAGAIFYTLFIGYFTVINHRRLGTSAFDLGIHVNWWFNAMHGHPERCPVLFGVAGGHFLGNHAIFAMVLWLPIFAIKPGAEVLLWWQAFIVAAAAIPLYLFASTQLPRWTSAFIAIAYLFYAPLHGPNFYDYHELLPAIFWHFWLYWAIATRRNWLVVLLVPIIYAHREDVAVGVAVLGAFLLLTNLRPRLGIALAVVSSVWFVLIKFVIMPRFWHTWFDSIYKELQVKGVPGFGSVVQTILINPSYFISTLLKEVKIVYFLHMFAPLAFLPARRAALLLLAIPGFFFTIMTTGYAPTISIAFQYTTHWVPYLFAGTVLMLKLIQRGEDGTIRRRAALFAMLLAMASHSYVFGAILQHNTFVGGFLRVQFKMNEADEARYRDLLRLTAMIPKDASVAASEYVVPHIAARIDAYTLRVEPADADYVLFRTSEIGSLKKVLKKMFDRGRYGLVDKGSDLYLFKKGHTSPETDAVRTTLGI